MATRRINLLPPDLAQRRKSRQLAAAIGVAGIGLVAILMLVYGVQELRLRGERSRLEAQEERNDDLRAEVARLEDFDRLQNELQQKTSLLSDLTQQEVRWSVLLADISLVIPSDVWLTNLSGQVRIATGDEGGEEDEATLGSIEMNGTTFSHVDAAKWLTRLVGVDGFSFPYLTLSVKASIDETATVNFNSSVQLSEQAFRRNQRGAEPRL